MTMCLDLLATVISVFVLFIFHHPVSSRPCRCIRVFCKCIAGVLCIESTTKKDGYQNSVCKSCNSIDSISDTGATNSMTRVEGMEELLRQSRILNDKVVSDNANNCIIEEWRFLAIVIDRMCFCCMFVFIAVSSIMVLNKDASSSY